MYFLVVETDDSVNLASLIGGTDDWPFGSSLMQEQR